VLLAVELSEHPMVLALLFMPFLLSMIASELRNMWSVLTGRDEGEESSERESPHLELLH
jgi:hypothetical protein